MEAYDLGASTSLKGAGCEDKTGLCTEFQTLSPQCGEGFQPNFLMLFKLQHTGYYLYHVPPKDTVHGRNGSTQNGSDSISRLGGMSEPMQCVCVGRGVSELPGQPREAPHMSTAICVPCFPTTRWGS